MTVFVNVSLASHAGKVVDVIVKSISVDVVNDTTARNFTKSPLPGDNRFETPRTIGNLNPRAWLSLLVDPNAIGSDCYFIGWRLPRLEFGRWGKVDSLDSFVPSCVSRLKAIRWLQSGAQRVALHAFALVLGKARATTVDASNRLAGWKGKCLSACNAGQLNPGYFFHVWHCTSNTRQSKGGSGTTAKMAKYSGRRYIDIEISEEYCEIGKKRLSQKALFEGIQ